MQGIHFLGKGKISIDDVPDPQPKGKNVVVRVNAAGICGTDRHPLQDGQKTIPGHEIAGEIIGVDRPSWARVGDRVAINCHITCRACEHCLRGDLFFCDQLKSPGYEWDGGFAEYLLIPEDNCHPLPDDISFEAGALIVDVLGTAFGGVKKAALNPGDQVAIWGAGPIGYEAAAVANHLGARVALLDMNQYRLELAKDNLDPEMLINPSDGDVKEKLMDWTQGRGLAVGFECVGSEKAAHQAFGTIRKRGTLAIIGVSHALTLDPWEMIQNETRIYASRNFNSHDFNEMIALIRNGLPAESVVTHQFEIAEARQAFDLFLSGECGKIIFSGD